MQFKLVIQKMITAKRIVKAVRKNMSRLKLWALTMTGARCRYQCSACHRRIVGFFRYGGIRDWGCPACGASPRERFVNLALNAGLLKVKLGARILHVAPAEKSLVRRFQSIGVFVPADIDPRQYAGVGAVKLDLMEMNRNEVFDLVYASHVLEHVPNDRLALSNVFSQLSPGGQAWLIVPLRDGPTDEASLEMTTKEREVRFGQWDHVRQYGCDFAQRMRNAGFEVSILGTNDLDIQERKVRGLLCDEFIFVGSKV